MNKKSVHSCESCGRDTMRESRLCRNCDPAKHSKKRRISLSSAQDVRRIEDRIERKF